MGKPPADRAQPQRPRFRRLSYPKWFYYDMAQAAHVHAMSSITKLVAVTQLLFGTDFPFRNAEDHVNGLKACGFSDEDLRAIDCGNAQRLLPRWRH